MEETILKTNLEAAKEIVLQLEFEKHWWFDCY